MLVAVAASSIVLAAAALSMWSMAHSLNAAKSYFQTQTSQARLIDAIAQDFRRASAVSITTAPTSIPTSLSNPTVKFAYSAANPGSNVQTIRDGTYDRTNLRVNALSNPSTYLTLTLPGYYQSNAPSLSSYRAVMPLRKSGNTIRYGTNGGPAPDVIVHYRKSYVPAFGTECYVRREADVDKVIVEKAEFLDLTITAQPNNVFVIDTAFTPLFSNARHLSTKRIASSVRVMMHNPRKD